MMSYQIALAESAAQAAVTANALQLPSPPSFYSLGDSFSAGIGANCGWIKDEFDSKGECLKCDGAYPYVVSEFASGNNSMKVYHLGCTGASMNDILEMGWNNRASQLELMSSKPGLGGWGTLSIGGNDVGFASIVANCIMFDRLSCDADLEFTESLISDPHLISRFTTTYLRVLGTATQQDFRLIVPGYAQFFNAKTEICDNKYIFYGRYLTQEFRARLNKMIVNLNLVIQIAVSIVQLQLVFGNSRKAIFYEDWDSLFNGHRFCEELPKTWPDAWFFTISGPDTLPNGTINGTSRVPPWPEGLVNLASLASECNTRNHSDLASQMLCDWALNLEAGKKPNEDVGTLVYPWWITKTMHPKSIAHWQLGKMIYKKWMNGDYF